MTVANHQLHRPHPIEKECVCGCEREREKERERGGKNDRFVHRIVKKQFLDLMLLTNEKAIYNKNNKNSFKLGSSIYNFILSCFH